MKFPCVVVDRGGAKGWTMTKRRGLTERDFERVIELALYNRDQCLEWASIAPTIDIAASMRKMAAVWDEQAADMKRDAAFIADSLRVISETDNLLRGQTAPRPGLP